MDDPWEPGDGCNFPTPTQFKISLLIFPTVPGGHCAAGVVAIFVGRPIGRLCPFFKSDRGLQSNFGGCFVLK